MPVTLVSVRHKTTGRKAIVPEKALRYFPDYVKTAQQVRADDLPDGTAFRGDIVPADADGPVLDPPGGNASKEAWIAYAVATGAVREDVEHFTRDELAAHYTPTPSTNDATAVAEES